MKITVASNVGFCFGVKKSIEITEKTLEKYGKLRNVYVTGDLVHNEKVMEYLINKGLKILHVGENKLTDIPENSVIIIRAHGLPPDKISDLKSKFNLVIDTTCPIVRKMFEVAKDLLEEGRVLFVLGNKNHPEMVALKGHVKKVSFFSSIDELKEFLDEKSINKDAKIALISQTTKDLRTFCKAAYMLTERFKDLKIVKTICDFTVDREREVKKLAMESDLVIVVGSNKSSNTRKLFNIARKFTSTLFVSGSAQLNDSLEDFENIAIVSGTSTPINLIEEVVSFIKNKFGEVEVLWRSQI
ncbi:MAG TPA: 4-hydroxy-3-methylbut-2-enyl diphosphate reductase [Thermotogaceae bacterium]|nr:4-hydroxy-3-methylbut-2-enyl diphosphate reductase [Thermotogaceae bacterium]